MLYAVRALNFEVSCQIFDNFSAWNCWNDHRIKRRVQRLSASVAIETGKREAQNEWNRKKRAASFEIFSWEILLLTLFHRALIKVGKNRTREHGKHGEQKKSPDKRKKVTRFKVEPASETRWWMIHQDSKIDCRLPGNKRCRVIIKKTIITATTRNARFKSGRRNKRKWQMASSQKTREFSFFLMT